MSEKSQLILMSEYNRLMNQRIFEAAGKLSKATLTEDKGAFFKSIITTLNHIMIGDILWLTRFEKHPSNFSSLKQMSDFPQPQTLDKILFDDISTFLEQRRKLDTIIHQFCHELTEEDINSALTYTNFMKENHSKRFGYLVLHVFLHQIHHRGQVTTLLSQESLDFGETDLPEIVPEL